MNTPQRTHRMGRFTIDRNSLVRNWQNYLPFFQRTETIVILADWKPDQDAIEFCAFSSSFDRIPEGITAPTYRVRYEITTLPNGDRVRNPAGFLHPSESDEPIDVEVPSTAAASGTASPKPATEAQR